MSFVSWTSYSEAIRRLIFGGMGRVWCLHGAVPGAAPTLLEHRFISDSGLLSRFLAQSSRFVPLRDALDDQGAALTVDDATHAAAEACGIARSYGHAVTLFINPGQVESGQPYWFVQLKVLLDGLPGNPCEFEDRSFPTATFRDRLRLREAIKRQVCTIKTEEGRSARVVALARQWQIAPREVPRHATTLSIRDLRQLLAAGVDIQNHGWSHAHHASLSPAESAEEVRRGRDWLHHQLGIDAQYFAVPFGDVLPDPPAAACCSTWLTLDSELPLGPVSAQVFNRVDLTLQRGPGVLTTARERIGRSLKTLAALWGGSRGS